MATSMFADSRSDRVLAEINITPLVDVMLVLLVIFMVTAPLVSRTLELRLPQTPNRIQPERPPRLTLGVRADGSYTVDGVALEAQVLERTLTQVARRAPDTIVAISAQEDADYQAFTRALAASRNSGLENMMLEP